MEKSEYKEFAALALSYFHAADALSGAQSKRGRCLFRPTLFVLGQGLELMLKGCMLLNNKPIIRKGSKGHELRRLWNDDASAEIRDRYLINAEVARCEAADTGFYKAVPKTMNDKLATNMLFSLIDFHGEGIARYPVPEIKGSPRKGPRTAWLSKSLFYTAHDFYARTEDFRRPTTGRYS